MKYLTFIFLVIPQLAFSQICDTIKEREILEEFYHSLNGDHWKKNTNWLSNKPVGTWYGIRTNSKGCVTSLAGATDHFIYDTDNNFEGKIPKSIGNLVFLKRLNLWSNKITNIPKEIGQLKQLTDINLSYNQIKGEIPKEIFGTPNLHHLIITNNQIDSLPKGIEYSTSLKIIDLTANNLKGIIPESISNLQALVYLKLTNNNLSGVIPKSIGKMKNLKGIVFNNNKLTEEIPKEIGHLKNLEYFLVRQNQLTGQIPNSFRNLKNIEMIDLGKNKLKDTIPYELIKLPNLNIIHISSNDFTGCISEENKKTFSRRIKADNNPKLPYNGNSYKIKEAKSLKDAPCDDGNINTINDKITEHCECKGTPTKDLSHQEIDSLILISFFKHNHGEKWTTKTNWGSNYPLSTWYGIKLNKHNRVKEINLADNYLLGHLTKEIKYLKKLEILNLNHNRISGKIPDEIAQLSKLQVLFLNNNRFSKDIPQAIISKYVKLSNKRKKYFNLKNNPKLPFHGDLDKMCESKKTNYNYHIFSKIKNIYLEKKYADFDCRKRDSTALMLLYNSTNGKNWINNKNWGTEKPLGKWHGIIAYPDCVMEINLDSNNLSGYIPKEIGNLKFLKDINLSNNYLKSIPKEITKLKQLEYFNIGNSHLSGKIHKQIGNLRNLKAISLQNNNLTGSIPESIEKLKIITHLNLHQNHLTGLIPENIGNLSYISLQNNNLSGKINQNILNFIDKGNYNHAILNNNPQLAYQGYSQYFHKKQIDTPCNDLNPNTYNDKINKKYNCKGTKIPRYISFHKKDSLALISLFYSANGGNWKNNTNWLSKKPIQEWYGIKTNKNGRVTEINLNGNNLKGLFPSDMIFLTQLKVLNLGNNKFPLFPKELFELTNLEILNLNHVNNDNKAFISMPSDIGKLSNLVELYLNNNKIIGVIPKSIGQLIKLKKLDLWNNLQKGALPNEIGNLKQLEELKIDINRFHKEIPIEIMNLPHFDEKWIISLNNEKD